MNGNGYLDLGISVSGASNSPFHAEIYDRKNISNGTLFILEIAVEDSSTSTSYIHEFSAGDHVDSDADFGTSGTISNELNGSPIPNIGDSIYIGFSISSSTDYVPDQYGGGTFAASPISINYGWIKVEHGIFVTNNVGNLVPSLLVISSGYETEIGVAAVIPGSITIPATVPLPTGIHLLGTALGGASLFRRKKS